MVTIGLVIAALFCALQVMRAQRLMMSTIWLALTSALVAILLFMVGAPEVAVIELSVGAGLVTVLFVFAFSIVGEVTLDPVTIIPRLLVWSVILSVSFILGSLTLPVEYLGGKMETASFAVVLWEQRGLDVLAQIVLIFAGVIGVVGLLSESSSEAGITHRDIHGIELTVTSIPHVPLPDLPGETERDLDEVLA